MSEPRTLPWAWYTAPAVFAAERDRIFKRSWHYVGHSGELPVAGSFFPTEVGGIPIVVVRGQDAKIRGLLNVCRHRGSIICDTAGRRDTLQCPYHGWTYELDGRLRSAPRSDREESFDPAEHSLVPVPVDTWGPFIFASPDPIASLAESLSDLPAQVESAGVEVGNLSFHKRSHTEYQANWKICAENFLECYHCQIAHPAFSRAIAVGPDEYRLEVSPTFTSQYGPVRDRVLSDYDPSGQVPRGQFHLLWPSTTINIMPGRQNLSIGPVMPLGPDRTARFLDYFFAPDTEEGWIAEMIAFDGQVGAEDLDLVERVHKGMRAGMIDHGRLFLDSEKLIAHFQGLVRAALSG